MIGFGTQFIELNEFSDEQLEAFGAAEEEVHSVESLLSVAANLAYGLTDDFYDWVEFFLILIVQMFERQSMMVAQAKLS